MIGITYATTPPNVGVLGMCGAGVAERSAAPWAGTAVPAAVRLRVPMTGQPIGSARTTDHKSISHTPGDLPPRDPLS